MINELRIEIFGRVQGVRFRHFIKEIANRLFIKGYVVNKEDGSVLVVAQEDKKTLEDFLDKVSRGPSLANVEGVSYYWRKSEKKFDNFEIVIENNYFYDQGKSLINLGKKVFRIREYIPLHVAIIPDGNRRWAESNGMDKTKGHEIGGSFDRISKIFKKAESLGVKYLTFWIFSTENWNRNKKEIGKLFVLFIKILNRLKKELIQNEIRFRHLGRKDRLPKKLVKVIENLEELTKNYKKFNVQLCIDYGGRDEIVRAVNNVLREGVQEIKEDDFAGYLDSSGVPDPDLIIRTSGEKRMSGFMSFQSAYSEFYFTDLHFPDFDDKEFERAVVEFVRRRRRFGK